jgi:rhamnulokinase
MQATTDQNGYHVAVDLGAGSGRLILGRVRAGKIEIQELSRFSTPESTDGQGKYQSWDIDAIEAHIREGLQQCTQPIVSVGVDSWGVDYVLLDLKNQRVGAVVCYRDARTEGMMEWVQSRMAKTEIYQRTGIQFQRFNTLYQVAACATQEKAWLDQACHLAMIPDYLHFRLCGVLANEYTNATTTQMLNISGQWDTALLKAAGMETNIMESPVPSGTILGAMKAEGPGVTAIQVIAPATHDTASAVAGAPLESIDEAYISSGTWSLMGIESRKPFVSQEAMRMNFTNEGGVERRFRVLKNIMGMWPLQRICKEAEISAIETLVAGAQQAPAWRSVVNLDDEVFLNPASMTATIRGYCQSTSQPVPKDAVELARCIFESLALSYRNVKEQLETLREGPLSRIRIIGGGCRNELLNQLCADACQLPVSAGPIEASALGNLCVQMIAMGEIANLDEARALIQRSFPVQQYQPQSAVPAAVWARFQQLLQYKYQAMERESVTQ